MQPHGPDTDHDLIERAKVDHEAFGALFERHFDPIFGYIARRTGDYDAARDLTSETFLKALKNVSRYRVTDVPVSAWLYAIATNEIRLYFRRGRRAPLSLDQLSADAGLDVPSWSELASSERESADLELERTQEFARVQRALLEIPIKYQEVIALRFFEEKSIAEVAAILEKPEGTVKSLLSRGLARLREILK